MGRFPLSADGQGTFRWVNLVKNPEILLKLTQELLVT